IALVGFADDRAIVNGRGRPGAALGPAEARRFLSRLTPGDGGELDGLAIGDLGDAASSGSIEETHTLVEEAALEALRAGACVVLLGGGHDGAFASHSALLRAVPGRVGAVNVDAHLDVRPLRNGKITSGTPFRRLAEPWGDRYGLHAFGLQPQHHARAHRLPSMWTGAPRASRRWRSGASARDTPRAPDDYGNSSNWRWASPIGRASMPRRRSSSARSWAWPWTVSTEEAPDCRA